jgi:hypothetical protein
MVGEPQPPAASSFTCADCGATLTVRSTSTLVIACGHCGAVLDARDARHQRVAKYQANTQIQPRIPLGTRGEIRGETFECIGFLIRETVVEGVAYRWREYLLWHPHRGYRWLAESNNHWTYLKPVAGRAAVAGTEAKYLDRTYKQFQSGKAKIAYVVGEFNWRIEAGESSHMTDYVAPPFLLCHDKSGNEEHWTVGEYLDAKLLWEGFRLPGEPPAPEGVGPAQPSPYAASAPAMSMLFWCFFGALWMIQIVGCAVAQNSVVHSENFKYASTDAEKSRVTSVFELTGRTSNVEVTTTAGVNNNWAYFNYALINDDTGDAINFGRNVEFYQGVDDGEAWSEGGQTDTAVVGGVPAGRWYLRVEPDTLLPQLNYGVTIKRDVPAVAWFLLALPLVCIPHWWFLWRKRSFEYRRWLESDFPMRPLVQGSSSSDDDE